MKYFLNFVIFISMLSMLCSCGDKSENDEAFQYSNTTKEIFAELEKVKKLCSEFKTLADENEWDMFHDEILDLLTKFRDEVGKNKVSLDYTLHLIHISIRLDKSLVSFEDPPRILKKENRSTLVQHIKSLDNVSVQGINLNILFENLKRWKTLKSIVLEYEKKLSELVNSLPTLNYSEDINMARDTFNELNEIGDNIIKKTKKILQSTSFREPMDSIINMSSSICISYNNEV